jgi:hypothetical protein
MPLQSVTNAATYTLDNHMQYRDAKTRAHFLWIDNYSKYVARNVPNADAALYSSMLWTGSVVFVCRDPNLSDRVVFNEAQQVVPAMPSDVGTHRATVLAGLTDVLAEGYMLFDDSLVKKFNINNIPMKVNVKQFPELSDTVNSYTVRNVLPEKLIECNIGSNAGLIAIMRDLVDEHKMHQPGECQRYLNLNVDSNIYWRTLKVHTIVCWCSVCMLCCFEGLSDSETMFDVMTWFVGHV